MSKNKKLFFLVVLILAASLACSQSTSKQISDAAKTPQPTSEQANVPTIETQPTLPSVKGEPTPTEEIKPTATPAEKAQSLNLLEQQGFVQDGIQVTTIFLVENPNKGYAIENSQYQVVIYNEAGTVLKTDSGHITIVLPSEKLGVVSDTYLEEGQKAAKAEVQLTSGDPATIGMSGSPFSVNSPQFIPQDYFPKATGNISNTLKRDITNLRVTAIIYDDQGALIGGGYTYLDFLPSEGETGVEISVAVDGKPAKVELYPTVSFLSAYDETVPVMEGIKLTSMGYGQDGQEVGVAFLVKNNNTKQPVLNSQFQVIAYDDTGNVLKTESGYIEIVYPGQQTAGYSDMYLPEGKKLAKVVVQIKSGEPGNANLDASPFKVDKISFFPGQFSNHVTALVSNSSGNTYTELRTVAVAYDEKDSIIGGGYTFISFIPANGHAPFSTSVHTTGKPARWEVYANETSLSSYGGDGVSPDTFKLVSPGYGQKSNDVTIGWLVENTGSMPVSGSKYQVAAYDADGNVLEADNGYLGIIFSKEKSGMVHDLIMPGGKKVASIEVQILPGKGENLEISANPFTTDNIKLVPGSYPKVTGNIKSAFAKDVKNLRANAIVLNEKGEIIGGGYTYVDLISANGQAAFDINLTYSDKPAKVEIFMEITSITSLE